MEKRLAKLSELIVDTLFLLPFVGVKVRCVKEDLLEGKSLYYPSLMLTELIAVIIKEVKKLKIKEVPEDVIKGLSYITANVRLIPLDQTDISTVFQIINTGWNDIFDAILYSAYKSTGLPLLTMDKSFYDFLNAKGLETRGVILT
ncbi:PIN domain-containing protein [Stygiolobus caldivivus]|uniref:PIN domain-containing protein n=1 Tax=Stygiolobus caldivivus TaxID=2824673 RepID=A0A8D5U5H2_9CREN|nr:PIN domain-containing protein [Stygiolobus caldivivus]BCU69664.1 PIN domain-containing protein [Stygiolobus caldivivus]